MTANPLEKKQECPTDTLDDAFAFYDPEAGVAKAKVLLATTGSPVEKTPQLPSNSHGEPRGVGNTSL